MSFNRILPLATKIVINLDSKCYERSSEIKYEEEKKLNKKESEHANGACPIEFSRLSQHIITTYY